MQELSRRQFLQSSGLLGAGLILPNLLQDSGDPDGENPPPPITHWNGEPLGRILLDVMMVYEKPSWRAKAVGRYIYNEVPLILAAVPGEGLYHTNHTWLQTDKGYIYSSWVQPCWSLTENPVTTEIPEGGLWGQVAVPMTWARTGSSEDSYGRQLVYYNQVQRVVAVENDYYLSEDLYGDFYWLKAAYVRIIPPEEMAPINPHISPDAKRIVISIRDQLLRAYEGEEVVFAASVSTGMPSTPTGFGEFTIKDKRPGQRMTGGRTGGGYNLAGVPWISYFTSSWIAIHGCYWHNDYGRRHSNGCVNMHPDTSKWVFRWTTPYPNYWDYKTLPGEEYPGTRIIVQWE